jgi:predicted component of type VI protein secretion system
MKKLITLTGIASIGVVLALISACETTSAGGGAASQPGTTTTTTRQTTTTTNAAENRTSQPVSYRDVGAGGAEPGTPGGF